MDANVTHHEIDTAKLKAARLRRGHTLWRLGRLVGLAASTLSQYEHGKRTPRIAMMRKLEIALRIRKGSLLL